MVPAPGFLLGQENVVNVDSTDVGVVCNKTLIIPHFVPIHLLSHHHSATAVTHIYQTSHPGTYVLLCLPGLLQRTSLNKEQARPESHSHQTLTS